MLNESANNEMAEEEQKYDNHSVNGGHEDTQMKVEEAFMKDLNEEKVNHNETLNPMTSTSFMGNDRDIQHNTSSLIQLFQSYSSFINESSDVILDMDLVLERLVDALKKLKPPQGASQHIMTLWNYLQDLDKESVDNYAGSLRNLPQNTLYDVLQNTERLYLKLALEFDQEINRGKRLGIIKNDGSFNSQ